MNDAKIMELVLKEDEDLRKLIKENDILIADRGFRDCRKTIKKNYRVDVIIPAYNYIFIKIFHSYSSK